MYRFLLSRRWLITLLIAVLLIPATIRLGFWQLHRHEARVDRNQLIARALTDPSVPYDSLSATPGFAVPKDLTWRAVTAAGQYDPAHEFVVRKRTDSSGDKIGYFVVTPLVLADGKGTVLVNRGWVPSGESAAAYPPVPAAPSGEVTLTGRLRPDEAATGSIKDRAGLPDRQYTLISTVQQAKETGATLLGGYLELTATAPAPADQPELLPEPNHSDIGPHMAYAIQWWLFTAMIPVGVWVMVRREAKDRRKEAAEAEVALEAVPA
ncbi:MULTISPECIES: SURF1 family protein [unclassified Kitasatospora]|uniref:SURF1 family cytochrome oxidase biogenesis protein n=1 Tax=unclassified Kitasatospora TaxID=2633591 RepID=UPI001AE0E658|nr:SURF1 family protein [Kitasatospora sp. RG8]MBP0450141.1 SURF1 family protein [Kitasatospora sp. RG8]